MANSTLSPCGDIIRKHDKDRYLCSLFAHSSERDKLFSLYAFYYEVSKIREITDEPMIGMIRLQWWREAIDDLYQGNVKGHEILQALAKTLESTPLTKQHFDTILNAREYDFDEIPFITLEDLLNYCQHTAGALSLLALEALAITDSDIQQAITYISEAYEITDLIRHTRLISSKHRTYFPKSLLEEQGITLEDIYTGNRLERLFPIIKQLTHIAEEKLTLAQNLVPKVPKEIISLTLQATFARSLIKQFKHHNYEVLYHNYGTQNAGLLIKLLLSAYLKRI